MSSLVSLGHSSGKPWPPGRTGRSAVDYNSEEELRAALQEMSVAQHEQQNQQQQQQQQQQEEHEHEHEEQRHAEEGEEEKEEEKSTKEQQQQVQKNGEQKKKENQQQQQKNNGLKMNGHQHRTATTNGHHNHRQTNNVKNNKKKPPPATTTAATATNRKPPPGGGAAAAHSVSAGGAAAKKPPPPQKQPPAAAMAVAAGGKRKKPPVAAAAASIPTCASDWLLPVPDPEAEEERIDVELQRLLVLKSYLVLDAQQEEKFDRLTAEACEYFKVPTSLISLVDLGRQFAFSWSGEGSDGPSRETPRNVAFCAHTILSKKGICVVPDTHKDARFRGNKLVTGAPHLRFYAGAPLVSPEGYKLGTFCVEGPKVRQFSPEEEVALQNFAARAMKLLVERKEILQKRLSAPPANLALRKHAAVATNLGRLLYQDGDCIMAMRLFQESVQTLMYVQQDHGKDGKGDDGVSKDRQDEMAQLLRLLSSNQNTAESRAALRGKLRGLYQTADGNNAANNMTVVPEAAATVCRNCTVDGLPGLFSATSRLKGVSHRRTLPNLMFAEAFQISLEKYGFPPHENTNNSNSHGSNNNNNNFCNNNNINGSTSSKDGGSSNGKNGTSNNDTSSSPRRNRGRNINGNATTTATKDETQFIIPMEQSSKATLFNMGVIHYHWGSPDTAVHFFDLASSLSKSCTPLEFDPVVLGCLNNMAQIHLQYGRPNDAMELLSDALTRGNAALARMYDGQETNTTNGAAGGTKKHGGGVLDSSLMQQDIQRTRRLRRKLARTVMNLGHVHFFNCDYDASMAACHDVLRLLHTNMEDMEVAAVWYNIASLHHFQGNRYVALGYLDRFLSRAKELIGTKHVQISDCLYKKGLILFEMGNLYECMESLNQALVIRRELFGENHHSVAEALGLIGKVLQAREEFDFALNALLQALAVQRAIAQRGGQDELSFDVAQTLLEVGRAHHSLGNLEESLAVYAEVGELTRKFFGARHAFVARMNNILGNIYLEKGQVAKSIDLFCEAMQIHVEQGLPVDMNVVQDPLLCVKQQSRHFVASSA